MHTMNTAPANVVDCVIAGVRHAALELIDIRGVEKIIGARKSKLYADAAAGLLTKPVTIGGRMSRWPKHEAVAIAALRVSGGNDDAVRALVARLTEARATLAIDIFNGAAAA